MEITKATIATGVKGPMRSARATCCRVMKRIASTPQQYSPQLARLRKFIQAAQRETDGYIESVNPTRVRIGAYGLRCRLRHVALERDVYYRSQDQQEPPESNPYHRWPGWATRSRGAR